MAELENTGFDVEGGATVAAIVEIEMTDGEQVANSEELVLADALTDGLTAGVTD